MRYCRRGDADRAVAIGGDVRRPVRWYTAEPDTLNRVCWALIAEAYRGGPVAVARGPLGRLRGRSLSASDLLDRAPDAALRQLTCLRRVYQEAN